MYRARRNYWCDSKLADKLRGTVKPIACTYGGWDEWKAVAQQQHPYRYWFTETVLDRVQDVVMFPIDVYATVKRWYVNKYITKTHSLISTTLKKGEWYDLDTRILCCVFDGLVDFVEVECAWMYTMVEDRYNKTNKAKSFAWWRGEGRRDADAGLKYLETMTTETDAAFLPEEEQLLAEPMPYALAAEDAIELYAWWKRYRTTDMEDPELETKQLIRLMNVRQFLWT